MKVEVSNMKEKQIKMNLIVNSVTIVLLATILFICTAFAWYVTNKTVSANGIGGASAVGNLHVTTHNIYKAELDENGVLKATGFAQEDRTSSMINKTSFVENCETSAWGRALGNLGIGIDESVASAEEVDMAIKKQEITQPKTELQNVYLCEGCGAEITEKVAKYSQDKFGKRLCYNCQKKGV